MATGKKFYWIKIKDSFMTSDKVDFLMSQKNGANYVVLYQMLCLKTVNTDGELARSLGEIIMPFDELKIQRDCKYFEIDTIRIALELYKKLGMIYTNDNGILQITEFKNMVGSETDYAAQKKLQRSTEKKLIGVDSGVDNVHIDIRDKILDIRDKENKSNTNALSGTQDDELTELFEIFESEFKRPLSSNESEKIIYWYNQVGSKYIIHGLREILIYKKMNINYLEKVLLGWTNNKITLEMLNEGKKTKGE